MTSALTAPKPAPIGFGDTGIQLRTFEDAYRFATAVAKSGLAPKGLETAEKILVALQAGVELGFSPMRALSAVAVVNGRPSLMGEAALAKIRQSGICLFGPTVGTRGDGDKREGFIRFQRKGSDEDATEVTFTTADAKRAGLWGKAGPWTQYPDDMLMWRAVARACKRYFSDVLLGLVIAEEAQDYPVTREVSATLPARTPERDPLLADVPQITAPSALADGPSGEDFETAGGAVTSAAATDGTASPAAAPVSPWVGSDPRCVECSRLRSRVAQIGHADDCSLGAER